MQPETSDPARTETPDTVALLQRILAAVEKDRRRGRLELALAIILSLATLASTWCGYQAAQWGGVQSSKQVAADTSERKAAEDTIVGLQTRTFDVMWIREAWAAMRENDKAMLDTIFAHMRPMLRQAVEAAVAAGVLEHPELPGPLQRPEYILAEEENAKRLREEAGKLNAAAQAAGQASDSYVLLTLMFASVLFFGGITGTFTARRVRFGLACVALVVFLCTMCFLVGLPVHRG